MGSSFDHRGRSNWLRLMTALVRYWIRLVAELNHWVRGFDAGRQERRQEHERAFGRLAVRHHRSDGQRPMEGLNWRRRRDPWLAAGKRQEELLKLLGVLRRKAVVRMG